MLHAPKLTGLSGNEIYCLRLKGSSERCLIGHSIQSMDFSRVRAAFPRIVEAKFRM